MESGSDRESVEGAGHISSDAESEASDGELLAEVRFNRDLQRIRDNDLNTNGSVAWDGEYDCIYNITNESWEEIGRDISNVTHLEQLQLCNEALDDEKASYLFRGLTGSSSIKKLELCNNDLSAAGVRSIVPFLQRAKNIRWLNLGGSNIQSEAFNYLCRALRDSPIETLYCRNCGIESIDIDIDQFPRHLKTFNISLNNIGADGCRDIAKLLQRGDSTLTRLKLEASNIDDEGVATLVDALRSNTSLTDLLLTNNNDISLRGQMMLLKLVNDISSVKATLQSNHTLRYIFFSYYSRIQGQIDVATNINKDHVGNPEAAGREKMIQLQLHSNTRAVLAKLQGVSQSMYSEINPLHLPEVLSLVGRSHGQRELYVALKSSIAGVISTVNKIQYFKQQLAYYEAKSAEMRALIAAAESAEQDVAKVEYKESLNKKRRRD